MKDYEKEVKRLLSDEMLRPSDSFKHSLRKDVMKKSQVAAGKSRWWVVPAIGTGVIAVALVGMQLWSTGNPNSIVKNPFEPQTVSAAQLVEKISQLPKTLGESGKSFMITSYSVTDGPARKTWCAETAGMGDFGDGTGRSYIYNDKNSGHEASYMEFRYTTGEPLYQLMYYNPNSEEMMSATTGYGDGIPHVTDPSYQAAGQPVYLIVDEDGNQLKDDTLQSKKVNGKEVYQFYVRQNTAVTGTYGIDEPAGCAQSRIITKVTVDAATNVIIDSVNYMDVVDPKNITMTSTYSVELKDLDEAAALQIMTKAGFDKTKASSEVPLSKYN